MYNEFVSLFAILDLKHACTACFYVCYNENMFRPDTDLYLLKCPLEMDNNNQLTFANATAQFNYFNSLPKIELDASSYQRKDGTVRFDGNIENLYGYNYCMYKNNNYSNKWFYAFVTDLQWSSEAMTVISLKSDVWQTWQFDLSFKQSFVEREHVNDDTIGLHTIPENLETGEYVCNAQAEQRIIRPLSQGSGAIAIIQVTTLELDPNTSTSLPSGSNIISGIAQGCYIIGVPYNSDNLGKLFSIIGYYDGAGKGDAIVAIYLAPYINEQWELKAGTGTLSAQYFYVPKETWSATSSTASVMLQNNVDGYTPKNNKLFTYPYNYIYVTNNAGANVEYHFEDFTNNEPAFKFYYSIEQGGSSFIMPTNSKKSKISSNWPTSEINDWSEGISGAKLPVLSWISDYYLNWKAVNVSNIELDTVSSAFGAIANLPGDAAFGGNPASGTTSLVDLMASTLKQTRIAKITPPQAKGNVNSGDICFSADKCSFVIRNMNIRNEYAQIIDKYFSAYGYRVNIFKLPNRTGRRNWNYVKTLGCNVEGDIPQNDLQEIKQMFDSGVTLWHNPATYLDYSQNNNIV